MPATETLDGNEAAARVAYALSEVIAIYPITPASPMGELADDWAVEGRPNIWGAVPLVVEMQSEAGAAGAVHGALQRGALATTFTSSQGLMLMIPSMFKIAGELSPTVFHVATRAVASHALSIFGEQSDVMATRTTGFGLMASGSVQEAHDLALVAHIASLRGRVPLTHFFDGFRTSHEIAKIRTLREDQIRVLVPDEAVFAHRNRALNPDRPVVRGTSQNPDVFFQSREAVNPFYARFPEVVEETMQQLEELVGRRYALFDYVGSPDAERVIVLMGSGAETVHETVEYLVDRGEPVGLVKVRLFRPFSARRFLRALPATTRAIAVLDRTKEPGTQGEPLCQDVQAALYAAMSSPNPPFARLPLVTGGRYGVGQKEFTPAMVRAVLDNLKAFEPKNSFTVGIRDDVSHTSLDVDPEFGTDREPDVMRAVFFGLGSDGTVGANKNTIKIIGEQTDLEVQGYFVFDSKKAGGVTVSHLRFGPRPIRSAYQIEAGTATFVACHHPSFPARFDMLRYAAPGATFLLNTPDGREKVWDTLPREVQQQILDKKLRLFVVDADRMARNAALGGRINTVMLACFFALSDVLPREQAIEAIKLAIKRTYQRRGTAVIQRNFAAADAALASLHEAVVPRKITAKTSRRPPVPSSAPLFVREVTSVLMERRGDEIPVSVLPCDGTYPIGTARYEKRAIAREIPLWEPRICIQCGKCPMVCPHAAIRMKVFDPALLEAAPSGFQSDDYKGPEHKGMKMTFQVAPEDCTGCGLCVEVCPGRDRLEPERKALRLAALDERIEIERENYGFFLDIPELDRGEVRFDSIKGSQVLEPLFEYSGACAGCGETPYLKLLSQLFGDRALIANATGCSSIYGGNLPTTPWTTNRDGRGPAWNNSLFEDAAEFGLGFRLGLDTQRAQAEQLLRRLASVVDETLVKEILEAPQGDEVQIRKQRERVEVLRPRLAELEGEEARHLESLLDTLVKRSVWVVGGDGWAYDIGFGGLDHLLASGRDVNVLVLDTEVYSNTGGQMSKSTPRAAVANFAAGGKRTPKKDIGMIAMVHTQAYVAQVAMGANDRHTIRVFLEAERHPGPSLIIAYCHCIAHGIEMARGMEHQRLAVECGHWPLYRYDPERGKAGRNPLQLDSGRPRIPFRQFAALEGRFQILLRDRPVEAQELLALAQQDVDERWNLLSQMAAMHYGPKEAS